MTEVRCEICHIHTTQVRRLCWRCMCALALCYLVTVRWYKLVNGTWMLRSMLSLRQLFAAAKALSACSACFPSQGPSASPDTHSVAPCKRTGTTCCCSKSSCPAPARCGHMPLVSLLQRNGSNIWMKLQHASLHALHMNSKTAFHGLFWGLFAVCK